MEWEKWPTVIYYWQSGGTVGGQVPRGVFYHTISEERVLTLSGTEHHQKGKIIMIGGGGRERGRGRGRQDGKGVVWGKGVDMGGAGT